MHIHTEHGVQWADLLCPTLHINRLTLRLPLPCSYQKFICTTLRPTQLPYKELYDYDGCAAFVADYLTYESLKPPNELVSEHNHLCR